MILVRLNADKRVTAQWKQEADQAPPEDNLLDVTTHPDGPKFMGRTQLANGFFGPAPVRPLSRREVLKDKPNWTQNERDEAMRLLL